MKAVFIFMALPLLAACSQTSDPVEKPLNLAEGLDRDSVMVCRFDRESKDEQHHLNAAWYLFRAPDRVESYDELLRQSQIWERDQEGRVFEMRVFHDENLVLEVSNGDLLASGQLPKWSTIRSVVGVEDLKENYRKLGSKKSGIGEIESFEGHPDGVETKLDWLPGLELPVSISKISPKGVDEIRLVGCWRPEQSEVHGTTQQQLLDYRHIDFSDLGDMESDPQVQRISKLLGHSHEEEAHH